MVLNRYLRGVFVGAAAAVAIGIGASSAEATPPVATPEPGGVIRFDLPPGEWWSCGGYSLQAPFVQFSPGIYQYVLGPSPIYVHFTPGADVLVGCNGTGLPVVWYGPLVRAGN
jgi:hypothetical protein